MTPEYVMRFAKAVCPEAPELFLSTGEQNMLISATQLIEDFRAKVSSLTPNKGKITGPIDWDFTFDIGGLNPDIVKESWALLKDLKPGDKVRVYGLIHEVQTIGMYDGFPHWRPFPSVLLNSGEWFSFYSIRKV